MYMSYILTCGIKSAKPTVDQSIIYILNFFRNLVTLFDQKAGCIKCSSHWHAPNDTTGSSLSFLQSVHFRVL
jgi:hypothetical protein